VPIASGAWSFVQTTEAAGFFCRFCGQWSHEGVAKGDLYDTDARLCTVCMHDLARFLLPFLLLHRPDAAP
jgi:hypothetical protein